MASFAHVGVMVISESGSSIALDDRIDEKLDAQIQVLLKRLKLVSPMRLIEVVAPSSEKISDESLTDADFADSALHAAQGTVGIQLSSEDLTRHTMTQEPSTLSSSTPFDMQVTSPRPAAPRRNTNSTSNLISEYPDFDQGYPGSLDETWLSRIAWHRTVTAPARQPVSDLEAVQKTIRLATEMNCDPIVMLELNRIQTEVANRESSASTSTTLTAPTTRNNATAICQFHFGAPTRRLL
ncbi:unnamed protein product [Peronospora belbahrii]|nr:unnamed protein product [Peronospora belbahrii]